MGVRSKSRISRDWDWVYPSRATTQNGRFPANTVAQASRIVSIQAECSVNHAVVLMVMSAQEAGTTLEQIAMAVVDDEVSFSA